MIGLTVRNYDKMKLLMCLIVSLTAVSATKCPDLSVVQDFNVANYTGTWYQQASINTFLWYGGSCVTAQYTQEPDSDKVEVVNSERIFFNLIKLDIKGFAVLANSSSTEGKLKVTLKTWFGEPTADYWVLSTDYDNYAIVYSCFQALTLPIESGWILTREQNPDVNTSQLIKAALKEVEQNGGPAASSFKQSSQKGC